MAMDKKKVALRRKSKSKQTVENGRWMERYPKLTCIYNKLIDHITLSNTQLLWFCPKRNKR